MGWSCTYQANKTLQKWQDHCLVTTGTQNVFVANGRKMFWELDRVEHQDGRITGEIIPMGRGRVTGFRINADGTVAKAPAVLKAIGGQ